MINLIQLLIIVAMIAGMWKMFVKAGQPGWAAIIPIYNAWILLKIAEKPGWWLILMFIPIVNIVVWIIAAIALAAKESVENLIASFIIFFDKPFTAGDTIKIQGFTGSIEKIGLRSTRIRTDQKTYVTVPNKQMVDSIVDNLTLRTQRKAEIRLQVGLNASAATLARLTEGIAGILNKPVIESPTVFLGDITPTAFLINADFFSSALSLNEFNALRQQVNLEILELMSALQVEIAGATTDIRLTGQPQVPGEKKQ